MNIFEVMLSHTGFQIGLRLSGPLIFALILFISGDSSAGKMAAVTGWVAVWWLTEAVPIGVSSLLPLLLMPALGLQSMHTLAKEYTDPVIFLFVGGFMLSFAIEKWGLHRRLAAAVLWVFGAGYSGLLRGVMISVWFLSWWISNTAASIMMLPIVLSIIMQFPADIAVRLAPPLLLGLGYAASIGGMATIIGTPTNLILVSYWQQHLPENAQLTFAGWLPVGVSISVMLLLGCYMLLEVYFLRKLARQPVEMSAGTGKFNKMSYEEKVVLFVFILAALLWLFRSPLDLGVVSIGGWSGFFPQAAYLHDAWVALLAGVILFLIPAGRTTGGYLLNWSDLRQLPYHILLLFGGGFALASGFEQSGLSKLITEQLADFKYFSMFGLLISVNFLTAVFSEIASNVATVQLSLPVLKALAETLNIEPIRLLLPCTFAASLGFMLPIATAPNTLVYGTGRIALKDMLICGALLDVWGILVISIIFGVIM